MPKTIEVGCSPRIPGTQTRRPSRLRRALTGFPRPWEPLKPPEEPASPTRGQATPILEHRELEVMRKTSIYALLGVLVLGSLAIPALAAEEEGGELKGYLGSFKADYERAADKIQQLADAIPAEKYGWAPAEGVRNVGETLVHVAAANFFLSQAAGVAMPEGVNMMEAEKTVTAKKDVIQLFQQSLDHVYKAAQGKAGADLDEMVEMFGQKMPMRQVFLIIAGHGHEHLGQLIAYARSNGIAPPWSQPQGDGDEGGGEEGGDEGGKEGDG